MRCDYKDYRGALLSHFHLQTYHSVNPLNIWLRKSYSNLVELLTQTIKEKKATFNDYTEHIFCVFMRENANAGTHDIYLFVNSSVPREDLNGRCNIFLSLFLLLSFFLLVGCHLVDVEADCVKIQSDLQRKRNSAVKETKLDKMVLRGEPTDGKKSQHRLVSEKNL